MAQEDVFIIGARKTNKSSSQCTLVQVYDADTNIHTDYVSGPNGALARIKRIAGVDEVSFVHPDHLGTGRVGTAWGGAQEWEDWHTPFGESLIHPDETDDQSDYTGHIRDKATGLSYMQARYYDPVIGRLLAEDPVNMLSTGMNPGYFNRYMYTMNNPVNAIDPNGESTFALNLARANAQAAYRDPGSYAIGLARGAPRAATNLADAGLQSAPGFGLRARGLASVGYSVTGAYNNAIGPTSNASMGIGEFTGEILADGVGGGKGAKSLLGRLGKRCCFTAGTLVATENGLRPIEEIQVGDLVLSRNPETGETAYKAVTDVIPRHDRIIWTVNLTGANGTSEHFETTDEHPWWVIADADDGSWKRTDELTAGMVVTTADNQTMIITSALETERLDGTYNITVADFESYFVGENKVLVHNCGRTGKQARLKELGDDLKLGNADRGWIKQERNSIARGQRKSIRVPPGKEMAHERGREAAKGYDYKHSNLQNKADHKTQHKYDNNGRKNKERPIE